MEKFSQGTRPMHHEVVRFFLEDADFCECRRNIGAKFRFPNGSPSRSACRRWMRRENGGCRAIEPLGDLADWLCLSPDELEWFADLKALGDKSRNSKLRHYHYRMLPKRSGGVRLTDVPKPLLKEIQGGF